MMHRLTFVGRQLGSRQQQQQKRQIKSSSSFRSLGRKLAGEQKRQKQLQLQQQQIRALSSRGNVGGGGFGEFLDRINPQKVLESQQSSRNLAALRKELESTKDPASFLRYVRMLATAEPKEAVAVIEQGWKSGRIPATEEIVRQYLKAAAALGKLDSVQFSAISELMNSGARAGASSGDVARAAAGYALSGNTAGLTGAGGVASGVGGSPSDPIYVQQSQPFSWGRAIFSALRFGIFLFLAFSLMGGMMEGSAGGAGGGIASRIGVGGATHQAEKSDKSFRDVVGVDEAKSELEEIVQYLKTPNKFTRLGGKLPKGVLLTGPPGTGKTLLARAIAGEAGVPFFYSSGSEFEEMFVGVGARRVRDLFEAAKAKSPCIIFIDEIDAIGGARNQKDQAALKMTLNQLLVEMDGFQQNTGVIVIAATNFPDSLDSALVRPGRFDKHVDVPLPDIAGRQAILELYGRKMPLNKDVDLWQLARGTPGFSGADLYNLVNQAAVRASVQGLLAVSMEVLEYAKDKIMMGAERQSAIISPETARMTAFHEAGHALVALKTAGANPIHKATIMPRGRSLGMVMQLQEGDQTSRSRKEMLAHLDICMGGRVAEELEYGAENVTSGAISDFQQATRTAHAMVTKYGLSEKLGIMYVDEKLKNSAETQQWVDQEVRALLNDSYARAKNILASHRDQLHLLAEGLVEFETLSGREVVDIIEGRQLDSNNRTMAPSRDMKDLMTARNRKERGGGSSGSSSSSSSENDKKGKQRVAPLPAERAA